MLEIERQGEIDLHKFILGFSVNEFKIISNEKKL